MDGNLPTDGNKSRTLLADDRVELLEVIREIVDQEIDAKLKDYFDNDVQQYDNNYNEKDFYT